MIHSDDGVVFRCPGDRPSCGHHSVSACCLANELALGE